MMPGMKPAPAIIVSLALLAASFSLAEEPKPDSPPLSPLESMRKIHVRNGYGVELVASEPLTMDPVAIDWSPDGRLWVVEMAAYQLGMAGKGKHDGCIRGRAEQYGVVRYGEPTSVSGAA